MPLSLGLMDPNLFHLDWDRTAEVLTAVILLSLLVERFLSVIFESRWYEDRFDDKHLKELIAVLVAFAVCIVWDFDAVSMIVLADQTNWFGYLITAGIIAGGSKASIRLFRDFLGIKSTTRRLKEEAAAGRLGAEEPPTPPAPDGGAASATKGRGSRKPKAGDS